jgi:hypothetical protein
LEEAVEGGLKGGCLETGEGKTCGKNFSKRRYSFFDSLNLLRLEGIGELG